MNTHLNRVTHFSTTQTSKRLHAWNSLAAKESTTVMPVYSLSGAFFFFGNIQTNKLVHHHEIGKMGECCVYRVLQCLSYVSSSVHMFGTESD